MPNYMDSLRSGGGSGAFSGWGGGGSSPALDIGGYGGGGGTGGGATSPFGGKGLQGLMAGGGGAAPLTGQTTGLPALSQMISGAAQSTPLAGGTSVSGTAPNTTTPASPTLASQGQASPATGAPAPGMDDFMNRIRMASAAQPQQAPNMMDFISQMRQRAGGMTGMTQGSGNPATPGGGTGLMLALQQAASAATDNAPPFNYSQTDFPGVNPWPGGEPTQYGKAGGPLGGGEFSFFPPRLDGTPAQGGVPPAPPPSQAANQQNIRTAFGRNIEDSVYEDD